MFRKNIQLWMVLDHCPLPFSLAYFWPQPFVSGFLSPLELHLQLLNCQPDP